MRPALEVADIFRRHGAAFRQVHAAQLGRTERRVMAAIETCRTPALGGHVEHCADCGLIRCAYNSCRNRHCPKCQSLARAEWLEPRQAELLPVPYFHVVVTMPAPVADIAFHNKAEVYGILFHAAAEAMRDVAGDPRYLGAEIGAVAVLHTWAHPCNATAHDPAPGTNYPTCPARQRQRRRRLARPQPRLVQRSRTDHAARHHHQRHRGDQPASARPVPGAGEPPPPQPSHPQATGFQSLDAKIPMAPTPPAGQFNPASMTSRFMPAPQSASRDITEASRFSFLSRGRAAAGTRCGTA